MTTNLELDNFARILKIENYVPTKMREELSGKSKEKECGIVNIDTLDNKRGHWTAYFNSDKNSYYFDSYGTPPFLEIINYLRPNKILTHNFRLQYEGEICGELCIIFLYLMNKGFVYEDIILLLLS